MPYLTFQYWFSDPGISITSIPKILMLIFGLIFLNGLVFRVYFRRAKFHPVMRKFLRPIPRHLICWGIIGFLLAFFRDQGAHYLSWRFLWIVFAIWVISVIIHEIHFFQSEYPRRIEMYARRSKGREWEVQSHKKKRRK